MRVENPKRLEGHKRRELYKNYSEGAKKKQSCAESSNSKRRVRGTTETQDNNNERTEAEKERGDMYDYVMMDCFEVSS